MSSMVIKWACAKTHRSEQAKRAHSFYRLRKQLVATAICHNAAGQTIARLTRLEGTDTIRSSTIVQTLL